MPAVAKTHTTAGAIAFAQFWFRALDWGYATTDSTLAKRLIDARCGQCERLVSIIDRAHSVGDHFMGGRITPLAANIVPSDGVHNADQALDVMYTQSALKVFDSSGDRIGSAPALHRYVRRVWLAEKGDAWTVIATKAVFR